jgi:predicted dehydrogenase
MRALRRSAEDGYLDQAITDGFVRVQVKRLTCFPIPAGQFFDRPMSIAFTWAYVRKIGLKLVMRKVRSRLGERVRNERCVAVGLGKVLESREPAINAGAIVPFVATDSGPPGERYVLWSDLVGDPWPGALPDTRDDNWHVTMAGDVSDDAVLATIAGWNPYSGSPCPVTRSDVTDLVTRALRVNGRSAACEPGPEPVREREEGPRGPGITVFGYGNYVKTMVIPELGRYIPVRCVHEIDPWQIGRRREPAWAWDTSPCLRENEKADIVVVASYHHTHALLAAEVARRGATAVIIEKPVATTHDDLKLLSGAITERGTAVYAAFQRRYSRFNGDLLTDLRIAGSSDPVSCFAVAYEVPLPPQHWYRWPASGSPVISNGCHWIDHFLWLNSFAPVSDVAAERLRQSVICVRVRLQNDAVLVLSLTSEGSPRHGMREHCEFRANGVTVTIDDSERYVSEDASGIIRRKTTNRLEAHQRMYRAISREIRSGGTGDSLRSLLVSTGAMLAAEQCLWEESTRPPRQARKIAAI